MEPRPSVGPAAAGRATPPPIPRRPESAMTLRLAAALAVAFHALPSVAQFEGTAHLKIVSSEEGDRLEGTGKLFLTSKAWRMETDLKPSKAASPEMRKALGGADS